MKVILLQNVPDRGFKGQAVEVSDGYANNFLFPQALAVPATADALARIKAQEEKAKRVLKKEEKLAGAMAKKADGLELTLQEKADDQGTLYAAVSGKDIAKAAKAAGVAIDAEAVVFEAPIKRLGTYAVLVEFAGGYEAELQVTIEAA